MSQNETKRKVAFPMIAHYNPAVKYLIEQGLGRIYVMQPAMTRRTMALGEKLAPDMVCTPFKTILGSMIEALEAGADTLIMTMGYCRLGYYGELAESILREQGYTFDYVNFAEYTTGRPKDYLKALKAITPHPRPAKVLKNLKEALDMVQHIDDIECQYYMNCGFETEKGSFKAALNRFFKAMTSAKSRKDIDRGYRACLNAFETLPVKKPEPVLKVGLIGEYFTVMDAFSNLDLEQALADMGVEVHRWMNVSHRNLDYPGEKNLHVRIKDYCRYEMGPTSTANIWKAKKYAEDGFDGIIHVKSAGCTPEIEIMPVLRRISEDYKIPVLFLTYDTETATAGLMTRLEAFYDMIAMRRKVIS